MTEYRIEIQQRGKWIQVGEAIEDKLEARKEFEEIIGIQGIGRVRIIRTEVVDTWKP